MALSTLYSQLNSLERDIADVHKKIADETKRELDKQKQIDSMQRSLTTTTSASTIQSRMNQIRSYQSDLFSIQKKKAELYKKQSDLTQHVNTKKQEIFKEEQRERDKANKEQENFKRKIERDMQNQKRTFTELFHQNPVTPLLYTTNPKQYDFFISHASEDKDYVRPLAEKLIKSGKKVWLDELILTIGDSLRRRIDEGLKNSKFGIVILSTDFFKKNWTQHELDGLVAREMNGSKVILPIWHKITKDDLLNYSPSLVDKFAFKTTDMSVDEIVEQLIKVV